MSKITELDDSSNISFIHLSDIHSSDVSVNEAICAVINSNVDFIILTGDLLADNELIAKIASSPKPVFIVPGNHDCYEMYGHEGFRSRVANRIMDSRVEYGEDMVNYYSCDYHKNNRVLRIIGLDQFDTEQYEHKDYVVFSQKQIDWFCNTLKKSNDVDGVLVLIHAAFGNSTKGQRDINNKGKFISSLSDTYENSYDFVGDCDPFIIPDIVEAYRSGLNITNKAYCGGTCSEVTVTTDFQEPSDNFIAYFGGHLHWDEIEYMKNYNQLTCLMAYCGDGKGSEWNDLVKSEDENSFNFNVNCYNFDSRTLSVFRIGAMNTVNNTTRDSISFYIKK